MRLPMWFDSSPGKTRRPRGGLKLEHLEDRTTPTAGLGWARGFGGTESEDALAVSVDRFGGTYVVGEFTGTVDFDPGPGIVNLTSAGSSDVYVARFGATGDLLWARSFGGFSADLGEEVAVDTNGNVYVAGSFEGAADFDPGPGTFTLTAAGAADAFVVKLDRAGLFVWADSFGGPSPSRDRAGGVAVDRAGNVHLTGSFYGTADFDPGPEVVNLTSTGSADAFVVRLDSAGNLTWARSFGGTNGEDLGGAAVDRAGNTYLTGTYFGTADFDPGSGVFSLTSAGNADAFAIKLDSAGNFIWAGSFGGLEPDAGSSIEADSSGNMYIAGIFRGTADFDPGPGTTNMNSTGDADAYVVKLGAMGTINWARLLGGSQTDIAYDVAVDNNGHVYVGGSFEGTADFDPGPGTFALTSAGSIDAFAVRLDGSGDFSWAMPFGGTGVDAARSLAVGRRGNVYLTGIFLGAADFDPGPGTSNLFSAGGFDAFLVRIADRPDLLGRNAAGRWWQASNDRTMFKMRQVGRWAEGRRWHNVLCADFTGDGRQDVLAQTGAGDWWLATPTASGFLAFRSWGRWNPAGLSNVVTGDFDGDFRPDVAGMDGTGDWIVGLNTGHGFAYETWGMWDDSVAWPFVRAGDFNDDGLTDLVGLDADGEWWVSLNTGDGAFTNEPWAAWDSTLGWRDLQVADFNNDGAADIAGRNRTGVWQVGLALPDSHRFDFTPWVTWEAGVAWRDVRVGDFTGDGLLDLIARHPTTGEWQLSRNSGGTAFQAPEAWGRWPAIPWADVLVGDFDGDGRDDLVGRHPVTGAWHVARSSPSGFLTEVWGAWSPGAWKVQAGGFRA